MLSSEVALGFGSATILLVEVGMRDSGPSYGFRVTVGDRVIAYSAGSVAGNALVALADGADVLVAAGVGDDPAVPLRSGCRVVLTSGAEDESDVVRLAV